jgi:mycothiol synthase
MAAEATIPSLPDAALPDGYSARPASWDDLSEVAAMMRACDEHDVGSPDYTEEILADDWRLPALDLARDAWVVRAPAGEVAGYGWVLNRDAHAQLLGFAVVHPAHRGRGLGTYLVSLREARAAQHVPLAPPEREVTLGSDLVELDRAGHQLLERHRYRLVRHFWQMAIDLDRDDGVPAPAWPEGVGGRMFIPGQDERAVHQAVTESFAEHWGSVAMPFHEWLEMHTSRSSYQPDLWFLAAERQDVAGVLLGHLAEDGEGWVDTLGVRSRWRGSGVGAALLRLAFQAFLDRGVRIVKLDVDAANETGATRLYERVGMHVTRRYDLFDKIIRPAPTDARPETLCRRPDRTAVPGDV